ncbi:hypothetical protein [Paludibacterium denitrificans]|uniref:Uncharacterized protein n=1 Tax=Paludibacterium denitrificans TaxID=2675226 RepID=A0A844GDV5_9NEIS|nr:hypothetical protein [Paludibacterium denitrificans]MTD32755.1 hypothetical protein [Paludibacterium denitrificans]
MVTYTALGNAPYLPRFLHRLAAQGVVAYPTPHHLAQHGWLPAAWQGFLADNTLLDLTTDNTEQLLATQTLAQQHGKTLIEVSGSFLPAGAAHGFMLLVGYSGELPNAAQLWLDAAAPAPGAWLPCGPVGSARFTRYILDAMRFARQQALADLTPQSSQGPPAYRLAAAVSKTADVGRKHAGPRPAISEATRAGSRDTGDQHRAGRLFHPRQRASSLRRQPGADDRTGTGPWPRLYRKSSAR